MGFFGGDKLKPPLSEERVEEQIVKPAAIEEDNGVITTTYSSIQNSLYDLADRNSKTSAVVLPSGTRITLAATLKPAIGSYHAPYDIAPKNGKAQTVVGSSAAAELAFKLDVLQLSSKEKNAILGLSEAEQHSMARKHLPRKDTESETEQGDGEMSKTKTSSTKVRESVGFFG
jgi:hypothetical protein